jgi:hypothetical protein
MKTVIFAASFISILSISTQLNSPCAYAAGKVDCDQVMSQLNSGKTVAEVAKDMGVAKRSVLCCRRHHPAGESKMGRRDGTPPGAMSSPGESKMGGAMATPPGAMSSPAAAAPTTH